MVWSSVGGAKLPSVLIEMTTGPARPAPSPATWLTHVTLVLLSLALPPGPVTAMVNPVVTMSAPDTVEGVNTNASRAVVTSPGDPLTE